MSFELSRSSIPDRGVFAVGVVVTVDVFEDLGAGVAGVFEASALEHFMFEDANEGFGPGVFVGIGASGHALAEAGVGQGFAKGGAAVLAAAVAVEDGAAWGSSLERLLQGFEDEIGAQVVG